MIDFFQLGSGGTSPLMNRALSSIFVRVDGTGILFDVGEGTQKQLVSANITPLDIDYILISHKHADHLGGLLGVLAAIKEMYSSQLSSTNKVIDVYNNEEKSKNKVVYVVGPEDIRPFVLVCLKMLFPLPFWVEFVGIEDSDFHKQIGYITIESCKANHNTPCFAYNFRYQKKPEFNIKKAMALGLPNMSLLVLLSKGISFSFNGKYYNADDFDKNSINEIRYLKGCSKIINGVPYTRHEMFRSICGELAKNNDIEYNGVHYKSSDFFDLGEKQSFKISYVTDTRPTEALAEFMRDSDIAVVEGMYRDDADIGKAIKNKHMTWREVGQFTDGLGIKEVVLTHYSPSVIVTEEDVELVKELIPNGRLGFDGLCKTLTYSNNKKESKESVVDTDRLFVLKKFFKDNYIREQDVTLEVITNCRYKVKYMGKTYLFYIYKHCSSMKEPFDSYTSCENYFIFKRCIE